MLAQAALQEAGVALHCATHAPDSPQFFAQVESQFVKHSLGACAKRNRVVAFARLQVATIKRTGLIRVVNFIDVTSMGKRTVAPRRYAPRRLPAALGMTSSSDVPQANSCWPRLWARYALVTLRFLSLNSEDVRFLGPFGAGPAAVCARDLKAKKRSTMRESRTVSETKFGWRSRSPDRRSYGKPGARQAMLPGSQHWNDRMRGN